MEDGEKQRQISYSNPTLGKHEWMDGWMDGWMDDDDDDDE
jgi:hypothetical protein